MKYSQVLPTQNWMEFGILAHQKFKFCKGFRDDDGYRYGDRDEVCCALSRKLPNGVGRNDRSFMLLSSVTHNKI